MDIELLVLRVVVGLVLAGHGARRLFGWFGGGGLTPTAWFFMSVGYRPARLVAGLAGGAELAGGVGLAVGLGVPLAAAAVIAAMLNVAVAVQRRNARLAIGGGYAYPLGTASVAAALGFTGPGAGSLDATVGLGEGGMATGLLVVALGLMAGSAVLLTRATTSEARPAPRMPLIERSKAA